MRQAASCWEEKALMISMLHTFFAAVPLAAIALSLALGYLFGKLKIGTFVLGPVAATLLVAIAIGQVGVKVSGDVKTLVFALFIYALGYMIGPQFVGSLGKSTLKQLHLTIVSTIVVVVTVWGLAKGFNLDKGTAAGVLAGGATESAVIGTASDALASQPLPKEEITRMQSNIGVTYAITYLFGTFTVIFFASSLAPKLLGIDLAKASREYERELGGGQEQLPPGQFEALRKFDMRIYEIGAASAGRSVRDMEAELDGVIIESIVRDSELIQSTPEFVLRSGDRVATAGRREIVHKAAEKLGTETTDTTGFRTIAATRDVVLTNRKVAGLTIGELAARTDPQMRHGAFLRSLTRLGQPIPITPNTMLAVGDVASLVGSPRDVERVSKEIGYPTPPEDKTDFLYFGLGLAVGFSIGLLGIPFAGTSLGLGTGGGCLIAGLVFGWLRARRPTFGQLPTAAAQYLKDFGLTVFVACIGLSTGPEALHHILKNGAALTAAGIAVSIIPGLFALYYGKYVLKMHPVILCGALCGRQASTPALNAVTLAAGNNAPVLGYTVPYTVANVLLTLAGPVVVLLT